MVALLLLFAAIAVIVGSAATATVTAASPLGAPVATPLVTGMASGSGSTVGPAVSAFDRWPQHELVPASRDLDVGDHEQVGQLDIGRREVRGGCHSSGVASVIEDCLSTSIGHALLLVTGGEPTADKPTVTFAAPADPDKVSAEMIFGVADCRAAYELLLARGAEFLTPPVEFADTTGKSGLDSWPGIWPNSP